MAGSIKPEATLSTPMVNRMIETNMFIISRDRVGYPMIITTDYNMSYYANSDL
jgi:hypothetical protein